jgi:hypothetical protein
MDAFMTRPLRITLLLAALAACALPERAAGQQIQPGAIVEVNAYSSWDTVGKVLKVNEYGILVLYRGQDGSYDESLGFTRYFDPKDVRPHAEAQAAQTAGGGVPGGPNTAPQKPGGVPGGPNTAPQKPGGVPGGPNAGPPTAAAEPAPPQAGPHGAGVGLQASVPGGGTGLMSQGEVLEYLRARIGEDPWTHPQKAQVIEALAAEIRRRGVDFTYETLSEFSTQLTNSGGNETTIPNAIGYNYGPPTEPEWHLGTWDMVVIGSTVDVVRGDRIYSQGEIGAQTGFIQVAADGSYIWKLYAQDPPSAYVHGRWRPATEQEMRYQGGAGIVLLGGKSGENWLMRADRKPGGEDDMVVSLVDYWAQRELGTRR